ncbi:MAG: DUF1998 domain-containing protein, partial [Abditibacteriota bacterium]|nr:DUF1998 domain-containing protein [Abditibacteriota bacterium]
LPNHSKWHAFFRGLKYVVTDEIHTYSGLFASHMAYILRRLLSICSLYGAEPAMAFTSATVSNPVELAEKLSGRKAVLVDKSGAPTGSRTIGFWNPPFLGTSQETRRSAGEEAAALTAALLEKGSRTITFGRSRLAVELMTKKVRKLLEERAPRLADRVVSYRAGYTAERRRSLEQLIFSGKARGVLATSALELGIDIGSLDACVSAGYPRRASALWQQFGRVGRGERDSLCVLVAQNSPIDQYYMQHPGDFFDNRAENCVVDLENPYVAADQLACYLRELPRGPEEILDTFGEQGLQLAGLMADEGLAGIAGGRFLWLGKADPAGEVNIRGALGEPYRIIAVTDEGPRLLGTCDAERVNYTLYQGAIYIHEGESYIVRLLDRDERTAWTESTEAGYYTVTNETYTVSEKRALRQSETRGGFIRFGFSLVTITIPSYTKKALQGGRILDRISVDLPETRLYTQSVCFDIPEKLMDALRGRGMDPEGSIHALEHILIAVAPVLLCCDRNDLGGVSFSAHPAAESRACIFIYDGLQGGCGICAKLFSRHEDW